MIYSQNLIFVFYGEIRMGFDLLVIGSNLFSTFLVILKENPLVRFFPSRPVHQTAFPLFSEIPVNGHVEDYSIRQTAKHVFALIF